MQTILGYTYAISDLPNNSVILRVASRDTYFAIIAAVGLTVDDADLRITVAAGS